jgi:hypothetical protein
MCACEPGYVCARCRDTRHDPGYFDSPTPPPDELRFEEMYSPGGMTHYEDVAVPALEDFR